MTAIYLLLVLGVTIFIHELGHFIFAKKAKIYVYEFALGMGPRIFKFKRKNDETIYSLRLFPIGGFVDMAGEGRQDDPSVKDSGKFTSKTWLERVLTVIAGVVFNFILAIVLFWIIGAFVGPRGMKPFVGHVSEGSQAYNSNVEVNDVFYSVNGIKILSYDHLMLELSRRQSGEYEIVLVSQSGEEKVFNAIINEENEKFGFSIDRELKSGIINTIIFGFTQFLALIHQMILVIFYLVTGQMKLGALSGPVGIYSIVGEAASYGIITLLYLTAVININIGFINILPIPAFDGGRLVFLFIEKIFGKKVPHQLEATIHGVGLALLMILMVLVTYNDIVRLGK
jgi:regulator of sigma E protease